VPRSRFALMDSIAPDVTVVHGATGVTAEIVAWGVARRKPVVFLSGSDMDFMPEHKQGVATLYGDPGKVAAYSVEKASVHVVQTPRQQELLRAVYGREAVVARNPIDLTRSFPKRDDGSVLWVGKSDTVKRPELAIEVARGLPHARFVLIMNVSNPQIFASVADGARAAGNVEIIPWVPFGEVESYFARAAVFLSTSRIEGFPNTFLQAAKYEVPVASLAVDPGEMLERHGAGIDAKGDMELLVRELGDLVSNPERRRQVGAKARAYAEEHHDQVAIFERLEQTLLKAARR
jgi:glycosyltransferase involved in cell wall biosynthesis